MTRRPTYTDLERMLRAKDLKISRMEQGKDHSDTIIKDLQRDLRKAKEGIAALEAANERLVKDNLRLRAEARPLLTEAEDEEGTKRMAELELRGTIQ